MERAAYRLSQNASVTPAKTPSPTGRPPFPTPFFYGWVIVACSVAGSFLSSGTSNVVMSVLLKPMSDETGWSRTMIVSAISMGSLASGLISPVAGRMADVIGARILVPLGALISGALYYVVGLAAIYPVFLVGYTINRSVSTSTVGGVAGQTVVVSWFGRRRPRALGMVSMAGALGATAMGIMAQFLLDDIGWRGVMFIYGTLILLFMVIPAAFLLRKTPEETGLWPDNEPPEPPETAGTEQPGRRRRNYTNEYPWTLSEAMRTRALWLLIFGSGLASFAITGVSVNQIAYFADRGLPPEAAAGILAVYTFSSAIASLLWGFLIERFDERLVSSASFALAAGCLWYLTQVDSMPKAFLFVAVFGTCARGQNNIISILFAQYFGRRSYGTIHGFTNFIHTFFSSAGPLATALAFDLTGSYISMFRVLIFVFVVAASSMFMAFKPKPPAQRPPALDLAMG